MSKTDRLHERATADLYDRVRPATVDKGPCWPRVKRFAEGFGTGYALASVLRKLTR